MFYAFLGLVALSVVVFALGIVQPSTAYTSSSVVRTTGLQLIAPVWLVHFAVSAFALWCEDDDDEDDDDAEDGHWIQFPPWNVRRGNWRQYLMVFNFLLAACAVAMRWVPAWWLWQVTSVSGACSGSTIPDDPDVAFSAAGYFGPTGSAITQWFPLFAWTTNSYGLYQAVTCVFNSTIARWGDDNGLSIVGYPTVHTQAGYVPDTSQPACAPTTPCLVTPNPADWPNPAMCLAGGFFYGLNASYTSAAELCPGSVHDYNGNVVGRSVCAYCLPYARKHQGFVDPNTAYCPQLFPGEVRGSGAPLAEDNWLVCGSGLCPDPAAGVTPDEALAAQSLFDVTAIWLPVQWTLSAALEAQRYRASILRVMRTWRAWGVRGKRD